MKFTVSDARSLWVACIYVRGTRLSTYSSQVAGLNGLQDVPACGWRTLNHDTPLPGSSMRRRKHAKHRYRYAVHGYPHGLRMAGYSVRYQPGVVTDCCHNRPQAKIWREVKAPYGQAASFLDRRDTAPESLYSVLFCMPENYDR